MADSCCWAAGPGTCWGGGGCWSPGPCCAASSLACGLAGSQGLLVGARLAQGFGAAMMSPAALFILTTTFQGSDRHKALGVWAGISGMATAVGLLFGGLLTTDFGWRWVFFVSLPIAALVLFGAVRILKADHGRSVPGGFDVAGAVLVTASMLLLIFTLVKAPDEGWGAGRTIGGLAAPAVLMAAFVINEQRCAHPLVPLSIFRIKGLAAADATQVIAWAGFSRCSSSSPCICRTSWASPRCGPGSRMCR